MDFCWKRYTTLNSCACNLFRSLILWQLVERRQDRFDKPECQSISSVAEQAREVLSSEVIRSKYFPVDLLLSNMDRKTPLMNLGLVNYRWISSMQTLTLYKIVHEKQTLVIAAIASLNKNKIKWIRSYLQWKASAICWLHVCWACW